MINVSDFSTLNDRFYNDLNSLGTNNQIEIIDFVVTWCARANVEVESIASLIKSNTAFKSNVLKEAKFLKMIKQD